MNFEESKGLIDGVVEEVEAAVGQKDTHDAVCKLAELEALLGGLSSYVNRCKEAHIEKLSGRNPERAAMFEGAAVTALEWLYTSHADPEHRRQLEEKVKARSPPRSRPTSCSRRRAWRRRASRRRPRPDRSSPRRG